MGSTYQFAARIALHGLCLAVPSVVVGTATFVACRGSVIGNIVAPAKSTIATAATSNRWPGARGRAVARQVTDLATGIAATASRTAAEAQGWAVGLNVAQALAMIALFRCQPVSIGHRACPHSSSSTYSRSCVALGTGLTRDLVACSCSTISRSRCRLPHSGRRCHICSMPGEIETTFSRPGSKLFLFLKSPYGQIPLLTIPRAKRTCCGWPRLIAGEAQFLRSKKSNSQLAYLLGVTLDVKIQMPATYGQVLAPAATVRIGAEERAPG